MKQTGHYGIALLVYSPVGLVLLAHGQDGLALVGGALGIGLAMTPDCDRLVPFVKHRGVTHTLVFALLVGSLVACGGWILGSQIDAASAVTFARFAFGVTVLTLLSHLLGDVLTPMGIRPFWPFSRSHFTLDVVPAKHWVANRLLFAIGVVATGAAVFATRV